MSGDGNAPPPGRRAQPKRAPARVGTTRAATPAPVAKRRRAAKGSTALGPMHAARDTVGLLVPGEAARERRGAATRAKASPLAGLPAVSRRAAAALFLERQWLDRPRARRFGANALQSFVEATGGLQIDSVNVVDRAHQITLWSRFGPYDRAALERLTYRRRVLFEYLSHVACFVSTRDLRWYRRYMVDAPARWKARGWWTREFAATVKHVQEAFVARGVLGNADFERPAGEKGGGWWSWKPATHALDFLWKAGVIAVHSRQHFHKRWALMDRTLPQAAALDPPSREELERWRIERSLVAMGAASEVDLRSYLTWPRIPAGERDRHLHALMDAGRVVRVAVEGERSPWFALAADLPALASAGRRRLASRGTTLLCPFDSFLWHRDRIEKLFGFAYRIEIYVPGHQRSHGYYTLPVLHDGHLIGRVDAKTHREAGVLEAKHVAFEPWFVAGAAPPAARWGTLDRDAALAGLADALRSLATHVGGERVTLGRVTPAAMKGALRAALAAHAD